MSQPTGYIGHFSKRPGHFDKKAIAILTNCFGKDSSWAKLKLGTLCYVALED